MSVAEAVKRAPSRVREGSSGRGIAVHIAYFVTAVLVSRGAMFGSLSPFGAALVAGMPFHYLASGVLGAALSYLFLAPVNSFRYIAVLIAIAALRWVLNEIKKISLSRLFPAALAFVTVFATGLILTLSARSEMSEVSESLIEALLAAAGAYFCSRTAALLSSKRRLTGLNQQELACIVMSGCILLLSLGILKIGDVSVGRILAVLSVLSFACYGRVKGGSIAGICAGIVFSLADTDLLFLSAGYSLSGLMGGLLAPMGKAAVVFSAFACNIMMSFASDVRGILQTVVLETAVASAIFLLIPRDAMRFLTAVFTDEDAALTSEAVRRNVTMRLSHCSKALGNVTNCVNAVSEKLARLYEPGMQGVYDAVAADVCRSCGLRVYCWEKQRDLTLDDLCRLSDVLKEHGVAEEKDVESAFLKRCCKPGEMASSITRAYKEYLSLEAAKRRVTQVRSVVAGQFAGLSDILMDLSREFGEVESYDADAAERIIAALNTMGLIVVDCACRRSPGRGMAVELELAVGRKTAVSKSQLTREVGKACGRCFDAPSMSFEGDRIRVMMSELPLYDLEIGSAQHICDNGNLCGDSVNYFSNGEGSTVAVISDGMGTGGRAAVDSNMAVSIMTKLCKAGLSYDCSLSVVNASLMIKSEEESLATLDLVDFNLFTGRLSLMKAGACTTYIRRGMKLLEKDMPSLPLGILNEARFVHEDLTLSADDMVVMISDGALIGSADWIGKLILSWHNSSAEELASRIVEEARSRRRDDHDDDITAIAMRVRENA